MATVMEQEVLNAGYAPPPQIGYTKSWTVERKLRPEERTNLTIEEAEALANGEPFELIDGSMVFKMADRKHSRIQKALIIKFFAYFEQNPIGEAF